MRWDDIAFAVLALAGLIVAAATAPSAVVRAHHDHRAACAAGADCGGAP